MKLSLAKRIGFMLSIDVLVLGLFAVLGEIACRLFAPQSHYESMQASNMPLHQFSDDMYLGFELRPGAADHNSSGFRGSEISREKPAGVWRVAIVGDSVTYGLGVKADQAFPAVLQARLRAAEIGPAEVLNFGTPAYSTFQEYELLKNRVLQFEPDLVVMVFSPDDTETSPVILDIDGQMCLFRNQFEGIRLLNNSVQWGLFRHSHLVRFLYRRAVLACASPRGRFDDVYLQPDVEWRNVVRTATLCREKQAAFLLVLSPMLQPYCRPSDLTEAGSRGAPEMLMQPEEMQANQAAFDRIRQLAAESPLEVLDLGPVYEKYGAEMKILPEDHEHLSPRGHQRVAEVLAAKLLALRARGGR